jgi:hypothetical protein
MGIRQLADDQMPPKKKKGRLPHHLPLGLALGLEHGFHTGEEG